MTTDTTTLTRMQFTLDLTGGQISTGGKGPIPPGYYPVVIREAGGYQAQSGNTTIKLVAEVTEGEHAGSTAWVFLGLDMTKEANKNIWQTALVSIGYDPAQVNAQMNIDTELFIERPAYLRVSPQKGDETKTNRNLVTREEYERNINKAAPVGMTVATVPQQKVASVTMSAPVSAPFAVAPASVPAPQPGRSLGNFLKR